MTTAARAALLIAVQIEIDHVSLTVVHEFLPPERDDRDRNETDAKKLR